MHAIQFAVDYKAHCATLWKLLDLKISLSRNEKMNESNKQRAIKKCACRHAVLHNELHSCTDAATALGACSLYDIEMYSIKILIHLSSFSFISF